MAVLKEMGKVPTVRHEVKTVEETRLKNFEAKVASLLSDGFELVKVNLNPHQALFVKTKWEK